MLVYATLLLRSRDLLLVFGVQWFALSGLFAPQFQPFAGLLICPAHVGQSAADPTVSPLAGQPGRSPGCAPLQHVGGGRGHSGPPTLANIATLVDLAQGAGREGVQESLANTARYAGADPTVAVRLRWCGDELEVTVADRRRGAFLPRERPPLPSSRRGLPGRTERASLIGGSLTSGAT